jgi:hypothetical protein
LFELALNSLEAAVSDGEDDVCRALLEIDEPASRPAEVPVGPLMEAAATKVGRTAAVLAMSRCAPLSLAPARLHREFVRRAASAGIAISPRETTVAGQSVAVIATRWTASGIGRAAADIQTAAPVS